MARRREEKPASPQHQAGGQKYNEFCQWERERVLYKNKATTAQRLHHTTDLIFLNGCSSWNLFVFQPRRGLFEVSFRILAITRYKLRLPRSLISVVCSSIRCWECAPSPHPPSDFWQMRDRTSPGTILLSHYWITWSSLHTSLYLLHSLWFLTIWHFILFKV